MPTADAAPSIVVFLVKVTIRKCGYNMPGSLVNSKVVVGGLGDWVVPTCKMKRHRPKALQEDL